MSFKRDGNDLDLLKNLQYRRVAEILGDNIPDDEALLLSNGRLTCTICPRRPIFDTIQILSVHRKGKKHLLELSRYLQHKQYLDLKNDKRSQNKLSSALFNVASIRNDKIKYNRHNRKPVLGYLKASSSETTAAAALPSANSQVRKYIKSLTRKQPLEKTVKRLREGYGETKAKEIEIKPKVANENVTSKVSSDLNLLQSGWIKDTKGKWIQDPNAEFDSDEEFPPI